MFHRIQKISTTLISIVILVTTLLTAKTGASEADLKKIGLLIDSIPSLPSIVEKDQVKDLGQTTEDYFGTESTHSQKQHDVTRAFEEIVAFGYDPTLLWAGSVLQGKALQDGGLLGVTLPRAPGEIVLSNLQFTSPAARYSATVDRPSQSRVEQALRNLLSQPANPQAARISFHRSQVFSLEQSLLQVSVNAKWLTGSLKTSVENETKNYSTNYMIRFTQAYYDVSFTKPAEPEMFFDKSSTLVLAKKTIGPDNPPAYVSTITYGRMLFVFFSANESQNRLVAALEAAQNAGFANLSTSIKKEDLDVLKASHITVLALGGGSTAAVSVLTGDALANLEGYLREGANFTPASPGYPISYTTKYLRDGTLARLGYSTNYVEHIYSPLPALRAIQVHFHTHGDDKDRDESVEMWVRDTPWKEEVIFGNWKKYTPAGNELAHDRWGQGDEWGDHTDQDFTLTFQKPIPLSRCRSLRWRLRKNPDSDSGSGWRMSLQIRGVLLNGSTFDLVGWPERLVGDGNQYDFYNEVFPCPVQRVGDR